MLPDWLHDMFGDPNAEATTEADLDGLQMRTNQKFADFLVEFNTLSSQVNHQQMPNPGLVGYNHQN